MKRRVLYQTVFPLVLVLFVLFSASPIVYSQGGSGELPAAKPTPTPAPRGAAKSPRPAVSNTPAAPASRTLSFNQAVKGSIDTRSSDKAPNGYLFEEYFLNAKSDELLTFQLQSNDPSLAVQIFNKDNAEVAVAKDSLTGNFKISAPSGGLPGDGEYRVRVIGAATGRNAIAYTLTVNRLGLLHSAYYARLEKITLNYRETDPNSVTDTQAGLEELAKDDSNKPGAFEFLGIIYLYNRGDAVRAANAMEQAIRNNGAAVVKISFDSQWRRMRSGKLNWDDPRAGWLRIRPNQLLLTDTGYKSLATLMGAQIKEISKLVENANNLIVIDADKARRPYVLLPSTGKQEEADLVIKLIRTHVMGKAN
ncbi:MAG: hypothetical protein L0226_17735 [Acidobacteria bacterium]|nr:hypothetical protein [Acidobacteriota bacterium]